MHLKQDNLSLSDLSINCYTFRDNINKHIDQLETGKAKESFQTLEKSDRLYMDKVYYWPEETMEMSDICEEPFNLHLFECAGHMNDEELDLALKIDGLSNIRWWYRNMEKSDFYIQGWQKSRFYPDLIIKTKSNKYVIVEYKGENLLTNDDTKYKKELGCKWAELTLFLQAIVAVGSIVPTRSGLFPGQMDFNGVQLRFCKSFYKSGNVRFFFQVASLHMLTDSGVDYFQP